MVFIYGIRSKYSRKCTETLSKNILLRPRSVNSDWGCAAVNRSEYKVVQALGRGWWGGIVNPKSGLGGYSEQDY